MLKKVVDTISSHKTEIIEGTLFVYNVIITEQVKESIQFLDNNNAIENTDFSTTVGDIVNLELSLARLNSIGYYENINALIIKRKYEYPFAIFYIQELNKFSDEDGVVFFLQYKTVITFIDAIKRVAKHTFSDTDVDISLIFRDDKSLILPLYYMSSDVRGLSLNDIDNIEFISRIFVDSNSEKKLLFINELIDALLSVPEADRFKSILNTVTEFREKCDNAYQYYLRDFSYNKLKIELDSKVLEFTQKIQSVINDSQVKLVTIPTAFVLVFATFDFSDLNSIKNIASILSLFIFAIIIQIFLNNQYSSLRFTKINIDSYRDTFAQNNVVRLSEKFKIVDEELTKQRVRLNLVTTILWLIPFALFIMWAAMLFPQYMLVAKGFIVFVTYLWIHL